MAVQATLHAGDAHPMIVCCVQCTCTFRVSYENSKFRLFQVTSSWKIIEYVYSQTLRRLTFSCLLIDTLIFLTGFYPNCHLSIPKWGPFKRKLFDKLDCTCRMLMLLLLCLPCIRWASKVLKLKFSSKQRQLVKSQSFFFAWDSSSIIGNKW